MKLGILVLLSAIALVWPVGEGAPDTGVSIMNMEPTIDSIMTYCNYTDQFDNIPCTAFSTYNNTKNVSVQVIVSDLNGYLDIQSVKVRIVLWDESSETNFTRFGAEYLNATFESGTLTQAIYTYSFNMSDYDQSRLGIESPPLFYRVKARVADNKSVNTSNNGSAENADYTYMGLLPSFDINITIEDNTLRPGGVVNAAVSIIKYAPDPLKDINITYELLDPFGNVVGSFNESATINDTIGRTVNLTLPPSGPDGTYYFRVTVSYPEGLTSASKPIFVTYPEEEGGEVLRSDNPCWAPTPKPLEAGGVNLSFLNLFKSVSAYPGETRLLPFIIENTGRADVYNLSVTLDGIVLPSWMSPGQMPVLRAGSGGVVIAALEIPESLAPGRYRYRASLKMDGAEVMAAFFYLEVIGLSEYPELDVLRQEIMNAFDVLDQLKSLTLKEQTAGIDMREVLALLDTANGRLWLTTDYYNAGEYEKAREGLVAVWAILNEAAVKAYLLSLAAPLPAGGPGGHLDFAIAAVALLAALLLFARLMRRWSPGAKDRRGARIRDLRAISKAIKKRR